MGTVWSLPVVEHPAGRPSWPPVTGAGAPAVAVPGGGAAPGLAPGGLAAAGVAGLGLVAAWIRTMTRAIATRPSSTADPIHAGDGPPLFFRSRRARRRFEGMGVLLLSGREVQDDRGDGRRAASAVPPSAVPSKTSPMNFSGTTRRQAIVAAATTDPRRQTANRAHPA